MTIEVDSKRHIVIIGGGIIGCTSAYFLTRHPSYNPALHSITLLEATTLASGASGKAGGLLALWAYPPSIVPLSYRLHEELALEHNGAERWGYRKVHCGSLAAKARPLNAFKKIEGQEELEEDWKKLPKMESKNAKPKVRGVPKDLDWFVPEALTGYSEMGDPSNTAQVHPYQFTTSMAELAQEKGVDIKIGCHVNSIDYTGGHVKTVTYTDKATKTTHTISATDAILAAGPWTRNIFPDAPIGATRAHSVTIKADVSPYIIFTEIDLPPNFRTEKTASKRGKTVSPEIFSRPNGEIYACGEGDTSVPLPASPEYVQCDEARCQDIIDYVSSISDPLYHGEVLVKQACYLPSVSGGGGPLIGETGIKGLLMATGHKCWGIQNSCATGKLVGEFVFEGEARSAKIGGLDPRKVM